MEKETVYWYRRLSVYLRKQKIQFLYQLHPPEKLHMTRIRIRAATVFLPIIMFSVLQGCAGYLQDRLKDASEMVEASAGLSNGMAMNVRLTKLAQAGFGSYTGRWAGLREGLFATWEESRMEAGFSPFYLHEVYRKSKTLVDIRHPRPWEPGFRSYLNDNFLITDRGFFEVGFTANILFFGIDAALDLAEVVDFTAGLFGADLLEDDAYSRTPEELVCRCQSRDAWRRLRAVRALRRISGEDFGYTVFTVPEEHTRDQIQVRRLWKIWLAEQKPVSGD